MKKYLSLILAFALLITGWAAAEQAALDAFHALLESTEDVERLSAVDLLDAIMFGRFDVLAEGALEALSAVTSGDIAAYASLHALPAGQVRNAWYRCLADALSAQIDLEPEKGEQYRNALTILSLFLEIDGEGDEDQRKEIRSQMNPEAVQRIADGTGLPESFVEFIIMSPDWKDDSWENDEDWRRLYDWMEAASDITLGSRDSDGSTRIADLQTVLISLGYLKGKADGVFGPRTQAALIEFQLANGLPGTGVYDAGSANKIQSKDAVARWDYSDDFWDSKDFDTADKPGDTDTPDGTGASAQTGGTEREDSPKKEDSRDTPDTPDTPVDKKTYGGKRETRTGKKSGSRGDSTDSPDSPD